jgi:hypothetical protein
MSKQVFSVADPFPGMDARIRRSLSQIDWESPCLLKLKKICASLKLGIVSPVYEKISWAHIGIPSKKVVIYYRSVQDTQRISKDREAWKALGWRMIFVLTDNVSKTSDADLAAQLGDAIKGLGK